MLPTIQTKFAICYSFLVLLEASVATAAQTTARIDSCRKPADINKFFLSNQKQTRKNKQHVAK